MYCLIRFMNSNDISFNETCQILNERIIRKFRACLEVLLKWLKSFEKFFFSFQINFNTKKNAFKRIKFCLDEF